MSIYLAPVDSATDALRVRALAHGWSVGCERVTRAGAGHDSTTHIHLRIAATDASGRVLGYGDVGRDPAAPRGRFWFDIVVDQTARGRGIGSMLYEDIAQFAREQGATSLQITIADHARLGLRFAARRGFTVECHESFATGGAGEAAAGGQSHPYHSGSGAYRFVLDLA